MFSLCGKKSLIRKSIPLLILLVVAVFVLYSVLHISFISAQQAFSLTSFTPTSINRSQVTFINFTIRANGTENITMVTVALPLGVNFYPASNRTNISAAQVTTSNTSATFTWANTTSPYFIDNTTNTTAQFGFNVSIDTTGIKTFTITANFTTPGKSNSTTQAVQVNFTFCGYVKNETGGNQSGTNVSIYRYEAGTIGPPTQTFEASVTTGTDGNFSFGSLNGSASNYALKFICYNATGGTCYNATPGSVASGVNASKVGTVIPPFPANMYYPKFSGDQMNLNGTTFYLQPAATLRLNATTTNTQDTDTVSGGIRFGYEVIDQKVGFPIESNVKANVSTVDVVVPSGKNYTIMFVRDPSQFPFGAQCNGTYYGNSTCPSPPKSNYSGTLTAGEVKQITTNLAITNQYLYGCINISAGANNTNANNQYNITKIVPRMVPWSTSAGLFIPPVKGDIGNINLSDPAQYNYSGHPSCSGHLAFYNISLMGGGIYYLVEFYARNGTTAGDDNNYYGNASWDLAAFQNVTIGSEHKELNITLYRLAGNFTRGGDVNTSKIRVNIVNSSGDALTTNMHVEVKVKNTAAGIGTINYMIESLTNGTFYLPILNNSNWAKVSVFPNEAPPIEKVLNLSNATNTVTIASISFAGSGDKGVRHMLTNGSLEYTDTSSMPILIRFLRRGTTDVITSMDAATEFNPMKAMVAGSVDLEIKVTATNVTMKFNNFDMFSAKQPPMFAIMDNSTMNSSSQTWNFGNFVPRDVYNNVTLTIPYNETLINESWGYNMSIPVLYEENPTEVHQFRAAWNISAGYTTDNLTDAFIEYNGSRYRDYLTARGIECSKTDSTAVCYMDTASNYFKMEIPHFTGVSPSVSGAAAAAAAAAAGGGGYLGVTYNLGDLTTTGVTKTLLLNDSIKFKSENASYNGTIDEVTSTTISLTIAGTAFTLAVNETKKIDLDADDVYEMSVTLEKIVSAAAYVNFKAISEAVLPPEEEVVVEKCGNGEIDAGENCENCPADIKCAEGEECKAGACAKVVPPKKAKVWLFVLISAVVIAAVVLYLIISKKKTE